MNPSRRVIFSQRLVLPDCQTAGAVVVDGERIAEIRVGPDARSGADLDLGTVALLPGLVDTHVHVNEPGRTHWEGFATASRAAAAGGITSIVVMPLNCDPVVTTPEALRLEAAAAARSCLVDYGFWGGLVPGNAEGLQSLDTMRDPDGAPDGAGGGVLGFKCFMAPSGIPEFGHVGERQLLEAIPLLNRLGLPLLVHAEDPVVLERASPRSGDVRAYRRHLESRPPAAEITAIRTLLRLSRSHGLRVHIVHVAAAEAIEELRLARADGVRVSVETCPHYLTFTAEEVPEGATEFKCAPPIREARHREALWEALRRGVIDLVATDHSPCPPELKHADTGDFSRAWGGISSLQVSLSAVWTGAAERGFTLDRVARWMADAPARLAGLHQKKGRIAVGADADLVAFDPDARWTVDSSALFHRHKLTPYHGRELRGRVEWTMLRGRMIFRRPSGFDQEIPGRWLRAAESPNTRS